MGDTVTKLTSYVNGYKVTASSEHTLMLENGSVIRKDMCRFVSFNNATGATYYRGVESEGSQHHNNYSAYTLDPEHGWIATHRLPLKSAIRYSLDHKERTAGTLVAVVPDGMNPDPILDAVCRAVTGFPQSSVGFGKAR